MSVKRTCCWCKKKIRADEAYVHNAGKHNNYYCNEKEYLTHMAQIRSKKMKNFEKGEK